MPDFVFDEEGVELLAQRLRVGEEDARQLAAVVDRRIDTIRDLERLDQAPIGSIGDPTAGNEIAVARALQAADINLDGLIAAIRSLRSIGEVWQEASVQLERRVADVRAATVTLDELAAGDLLADVRAARPEDIIRLLGASVRGLLPDAPAPGEDPELDAALARFDSALLPGLLSGELDVSALTKQQRRDLQLVTDLLGGDDAVAFVDERLTFVEVAGEDQPVTVTDEVTFSEADPELQAAFIRNSLAQRAAAGTLAAAAGEGPNFEASTINGVGGGPDGQEESSVFGEASFNNGTSFSTEVVDAGNGIEEVTITDQATGTQFSGIRTETSDGFAVAGEITFADGSTGSVEVISSADGVEVTIESDALQNGESALSRDLNQTGATGFGIFDSLLDIFDNFPPFSTNPDPFDPLRDLDDNDPFNSDNFRAPNDDTFRDDDNDGFDDGELGGGNDSDNPDIGGGLE